MPISLDIEGIREATGPRNANHNRGKLDLPSTFPVGRYACKWIKKGANISKARQSEHIFVEGKGYEVDGWEPYVDEKTKKNHIRTLSDGAYVLMVRPKQLQETLQKLNGNTSRRRMEQEIKGETVAGERREDPGILTHETLSKMPGFSNDGDFNQETIPFNPLTSVTTGTETIKVKSKIKLRK